jgi:ATP adenylyltransferase
MNRRYLFNTEKIKYIKGNKPRVECILCSIRDRNPDVSSLEIKRTEHSIVTVNLYPFNTGHLMVFPLKHYTDLSEMTDSEALDLHRLTAESIKILKEEFNPAGFNIGYNMGVVAGGSIEHIHQHIVPRYANEIGFIDVLAGDRIIVLDPCEVMERLKKKFN